MVTPVLEQMAARNRATFGEDGGEAGLGLSMVDMFMDMPLLSVFEFQANALSEAPEAIVDRMLQAARAG